MSSFFQNILKALGGGLVLFFIQRFFETTFLSDFLRGNLITILFALLAINAATLSVVLTKIRDLVDRGGRQEAFNKTKKEMLLSIQEQVGLIVLSTVLLMAEKSSVIGDRPNLLLAMNILIPSCLTFALSILYDTCKSVFVLLDFPEN